MHVFWLHVNLHNEDLMHENPIKEKVKLQDPIIAIEQSLVGDDLSKNKMNLAGVCYRFSGFSYVLVRYWLFELRELHIY